jgi:LmbE family N-acetylglucosaminyl deacetylase
VEWRGGRLIGRPEISRTGVSAPGRPTNKTQPKALTVHELPQSRKSSSNQQSMISLVPQQLRRVLCLGAHSDDIEIGCGATVLRFLRDQEGIEVHWVVFSAQGRRAQEARRSAADFLRTAGRRRVRIATFRESYFPSEWPGIKDEFERVKRRFNPDLVLTHCRDDRHQDHRVLSDLVWNTFRSHLVLEYEIPKYDADLGAPNVYVPVEKELCQRKLDALLRHFRSQADKHWFTADTFWALLRLRGIECASPTGFAEAFYGRKVCL